jgi:hypothetical protein
VNKRSQYTHDSDILACTNFRNPGGVRFLAYVQTGPEAHPASCTMDTGYFPVVNWPKRGADHTSLLAPKTTCYSRAIHQPLSGPSGLLGYLYLYLFQDSCSGTECNRVINRKYRDFYQYLTVSCCLEKEVNRIKNSTIFHFLHRNALNHTAHVMLTHCGPVTFRLFLSQIFNST